jgi:hypothetical protein
MSAPKPRRGKMKLTSNRSNAIVAQITISQIKSWPTHWIEKHMPYPLRPIHRPMLIPLTITTP